MQKLAKQCQNLYKQQFDVDPPKYLKYITIAFAGVGFWILRHTRAFRLRCSDWYTRL